MSQWTNALSDWASAVAYQDLPEHVREIARQCVLDCLGVSIAGASEPLIDILIDDANENAQGSQVSIVGRRDKSSLYQGALINGAIAHALDYDDVNMAMIGHPSAAILPSVMALSEARKTNGRTFLTAFVVGYETACRIGEVLANSHYDKGFHCTATLGAFGAAAGCAHLLGLSKHAFAQALGIAGTQAAGLKIMFGTMCKPLHAGKANQNGLFAACLAAKGFTSRDDVLEADKGFASLQSECIAPDSEVVEPGRFHMEDNLFKYHAACYNTHAAIEATRKAWSRPPFPMASLEMVLVRVDRSLDSVCNIAEPTSGLEAKFSLRFAVAAALAGIDTSRIDSFSDHMVKDPDITRIMDKVTVELSSFPTTTETEVEFRSRDGTVCSSKYDAGLPVRDLAGQKARLQAKFRALVEPIIGVSAAQEMIHHIENIESLGSLETFTRLWQPRQVAQR